MKKLAVLLGVVVTATGCVTGALPRLSDEKRAELGRVSILSELGTTEFIAHRPARGWAEGMGRGATAGGVGCLAAGIQSHDPGGLVFGILLMPLGILFGAIYGAIAAPSAEEVRRGESIVHSVLTEQLPMEVPAGDVLRLAPAGCPVTLASADADSILTLRVVEFGLVGPNGFGINSSLSVVLTTRVKVVRRRDDTVLYERTAMYRSPGRTQSEWVASGGAPLRAVLAEARRWTAREVVEAVLPRSETRRPVPAAAKK